MSCQNRIQLKDQSAKERKIGSSKVTDQNTETPKL
jgi:hypothetical protein